MPDAWRDLFATAIFTGLRKGELFGLRKADVDLRNRILTVTRSYDRATTKGRRAECIPIAAPLIPYLEHALDTAKGELLFPDDDGRMRSEEADPQKVLRWALGRAGIVEGYDHLCRRCKAAKLQPNTWRHSDSAKRTCPTCGMGLWPKAIPRPMRFHDVRHSTATMLLRAGVDIHRVQRLLRHTDVRVTAGVYGHLMVDDLREAVAALPSGPESTIPALPPAPFEIAARIVSQRVMTVRDVAQTLGISTATVYKMVETGRLPHFGVSNAIRIRVEDLPGAASQDRVERISPTPAAVL